VPPFLDEHIKACVRRHHGSTTPFAHFESCIDLSAHRLDVKGQGEPERFTH
jgi:hypothetical protein